MDAFLPLALAWQTWVIAGVLVVLVFATAFALFGRGSRRQIQDHPRGERRGEGQVGAQGPGEPSGRDEGDSPSMQRGTR